MINRIKKTPVLRRTLKKIYILFIQLCSIIPDELYLKIRYKIKTGKNLNFDNPVSFNEKIQWLKLYGYGDEYSVMADKYKVRDYIENKFPNGEINLIPLLGVYDNADDINLDELPEQFVVKCTHDSGSVVLCKHKSDFTYQVRKQLNAALKRKYYYAGRELVYKNVQPRIIVEAMMTEESGDGLIDFKFFCFHGEPKFLSISAGLDDHMTAKRAFYNMDLSKAAFQRSDYRCLDKIPKIPEDYDEMIEIARTLSKNIPFVRIDLYEINGKIYFSEITFAPAGGYGPMEPKEYDEIIGEYIDLNRVGAIKRG